MWNRLAILKRIVFVPLTAIWLSAGTTVRQEYLGQGHFARVVALAIVLHALALYGWHLMPRTEVVDIPVRALNIKLADMDNATDSTLNILQPSSANSAAVERTLSRLAEGFAFKDDDSRMEAPTGKAVDASKKTSSKTADKQVPLKEGDDYLSKLAATPKQFVRENKAAKAQVPAMGNSKASNAEIMRRYEQLISLWIQKFKQYPEQARAQNMQGETVVRIRIDRQGNIRYYILERSTGFPLLDRAAIDMIRRANPVPAVPHDYPPGDLMEFLIPVNFHLQ